MSLKRKNKKLICGSIKQNIKDSLSLSSISGVSHISCEDRRTNFERLLWILVIIAMIGLAILQGLSVLTHYNERPVIVTVDKSFFDWKLMFPSATLCYRNLTSESELDSIIENLVTKLNLTQEILTTEREQFLEYLDDLAFKNYYSYQEYDVYSTGVKKEYLLPDQYMEVLDQVVWMMKLPTSDRKHVSVSPVNLPFNELRPVLRIFTEFGPCVIINPYVGIYFTSGYFNRSSPYYDYKEINYTNNEMAFMTLKVELKGNTELYIHSANEVMDIVDRRTFLGGFYYKQTKYEVDVVTVNNDVKPLSVKDIANWHKYGVIN